MLGTESKFLKGAIEEFGERPELVFVFPRVLKELYYEGCDYHLGAAYIRAFLDTRGVRTAQYIDNGSLTVHATAAAIIAGEPLAVGFSCYDANFYFVKLLAEEIRRIRPSIVLICGGPTATFSAAEILDDCPSVDLVVRGYGEETTFDIVAVLRSGGDLRGIAGLSFRDTTGGIVSTPNRLPGDAAAGSGRADDAGQTRVLPTGLRSAKTGLDLYPDPYVTGFLPPERAADIGVVTSRGCSFPCTFCNFAAMSQRKTTYQSTNAAMEVFEYLNEVFGDADGKQLVTINDDNFSMHSGRFHELLRLMSLRNFENIEFWAEMRVEPLEEESFDLLRQAGFREINFGLESAVPSVLAKSKKVRPGGWERDGYAKEESYVRKIANAVTELKRRDIKTCVSVIFGLPGENAEDAMRTLSFVESIGVDKYAHNFITVRLGTELAATHKEFGIGVRSLPGRLFPFVTEPAYPVEQLPILPNDDSQLPIRSILLQDAVLLTSGTGLFVGRTRRPKDHGRGGAGAIEFNGNAPPPLIVIDAMEEATALASWLAAAKPMGSPIWLVGLDEAEHQQFERAAAAEGVACLEGNILQRGRGDEWEVAGRISPLRSRQIVLAGVNVESANGPMARRPVGPTSIAAQVKFGDVEDLMTFKRRFETVTSSGRAAWRICGSTIANGLSIEDGCRWSCGSCPAAGGLKYLIRGRHILPCGSGVPIGQLGDSLTDCRSTAQTRLEAVHSKRGCETCVARATCSQCMHTAPFTENEFCAAQRQGWRISTLVDVLTLLRGLGGSGSIEDDGEDYLAIDVTDLRETAGSEPVDDPLVYVRATRGQKAFLFSPRGQNLFACPADQREVLDLLSGVEKLVEGPGAGVLPLTVRNATVSAK